MRYAQSGIDKIQIWICKSDITTDNPCYKFLVTGSELTSVLLNLIIVKLVTELFVMGLSNRPQKLLCHAWATQL